VIIYGLRRVELWCEMYNETKKFLMSLYCVKRRRLFSIGCAMTEISKLTVYRE